MANNFLKKLLKMIIKKQCFWCAYLHIEKDQERSPKISFWRLSDISGLQAWEY